MASIELDLGGGFILKHFLKKGYTGYFEGRSYRIRHNDAVVHSFSDSQGRIFNHLMQKKAMTPTQIAEAIGVTPAAAIYNLKALIRAGVVERHPLPGGSVFYVPCLEVEMDLSPALKSKIEPAASKLGGGLSGLAKVPMRELRAELGMLSEDEFFEVMRFLVGDTK